MAKRMGLARIEALIENLKREINLTSTTLKGGRVQTGVDNVIQANAANKAVLASETGSVIQLKRAAGSTVTLPANATVGLRYTVYVKTLLTSSAYVINTGTNNTFSLTSFIIQKDSTDASAAHAMVYTTDNADVTLTMTYDATNKTALFGTVYEIECVAPLKWRITGTHEVDASGAAVFA